MKNMGHALEESKAVKAAEFRRKADEAIKARERAREQPKKDLAKEKVAAEATKKSGAGEEEAKDTGFAEKDVVLSFHSHRRADLVEL